MDNISNVFLFSDFRDALPVGIGINFISYLLRDDVTGVDVVAIVPNVSTNFDIVVGVSLLKKRTSFLPKISV